MKRKDELYVVVMDWDHGWLLVEDLVFDSAEEAMEYYASVESAKFEGVAIPLEEYIYAYGDSQYDIGREEDSVGADL